MKRVRRWLTYLVGCSVLAGLGLVGLSVWVSMLASEVSALNKDRARSNSTSADVESNPLPGLGEYMTTMQLHVGKLWFAGQANNWDLASYELDELREAMEAAQTLHAKKNSVDISGVLAATIEGQIRRVDEAVDKKSKKDFTRSYDEALSACNGCHEQSGHQFIKITRPTAPPVSNQRWAAG